MNKTCTICLGSLTEYVGFNSNNGDPSNPWDCLNSSCEETTKETTPGIQSGLIEWPNDWDVTWTALRAEIEDYAKLMPDIKWKVRHGGGPGSVALMFRDKYTGDWLTNKWFGMPPRSTKPNAGKVAYYKHSTPTQSAPVSGLQGSQATVPSSLKLHTPLSKMVGINTKEDGSLQLSPDLVDAARSVRILQRQEDHPPQTSSRPTLLNLFPQQQAFLDEIQIRHENPLARAWKDCYPDKKIEYQWTLPYLESLIK